MTVIEKINEMLFDEDDDCPVLPALSDKKMELVRNELIRQCEGMSFFASCVFLTAVDDSLLSTPYNINHQEISKTVMEFFKNNRFPMTAPDNLVSKFEEDNCDLIVLAAVSYFIKDGSSLLPLEVVKDIINIDPSFNNDCINVIKAYEELDANKNLSSSTMISVYDYLFFTIANVSTKEPEVVLKKSNFADITYQDIHNLVMHVLTKNYNTI